MAFELYFVSYPADGDWAGVMLELEYFQGSTKPFGDDDLALWNRMVAQVERFLPGAEFTSSAAIHELTHEGSGIQFCFVPAGIVLTVPYWYTGPDAGRMVEVLRSISRAIEADTGLIAYDPQAEAPFLAYGAGSAAATFDQFHVAEAASRGKVPSPKGRTWRPFRGRKAA